MTDSSNAFTRMVPGFDFLQTLVKNAGAAMPGVGQWVAPTLDPAELEKRIGELRTVQFWLEQNARLLGTTIQALEVQRMTLSTLKGMNVSLGDLTEALKIRLPEVAAPSAPPEPAPSATASAAAPAPAEEATAPTGVIDPMQWWTALTQQFTELAASAMKDSAADAARQLAGSMVKQGLDAASQTLHGAAGMAAPSAPAAAPATAGQNAATPHAAAKRGTAPRRSAAAKKRAPAKSRRA